MAVTQIDVDDEALAEVMRISGFRTKKESVNFALRHYVEAHRRLESLEKHAARAKRWDYDAWKQLRDDEDWAARG